MAQYATEAEARAALGSGGFAGQEMLVRNSVYQSFAGVPQTANIPTFIGEYFLDTSAERWYKAVDTVNKDDFIIM